MLQVTRRCTTKESIYPLVAYSFLFVLGYGKFIYNGGVWWLAGYSVIGGLGVFPYVKVIIV